MVNYRLINRQCVLCGSASNAASGICSACYQDLPWLQTGCSICALPLTAKNTPLICPSCQKKAPSFTQVTALFEYRFPIDRIISQIKYAKKPQLLGHLASLVYEKVDLAAAIDCIIPIPMHPMSQFRRGFNQSELFAAELAKLFSLPLISDQLRKTQATPRQMTLPRAERLKNQKGVYECSPRQEKTVLLVDDVMTTGATIESASLCLKKAGIAEVYVLVLARTER